MSTAGVQFEVPWGRVGVAAGLLLMHVVVIFGLFSIARKPATLPTPVLTVSFISSVPETKPWEPPAVQPPTAVEISLPTPVVPAIEVAPPLSTAPELIAMPAAAQPPQAPAAVSSTDGPPRVVQTVAYIREPVLRYPPQSRKLREQGLVLFQVLVDEYGVPAQVDLERSSGYVRLDEAGREALLQSRFRPYMENGVARSALVMVPLRFTLMRGK